MPFCYFVIGDGASFMVFFQIHYHALCPRLDAPVVLHHVMAPWDHAADLFSR